MRPTINTSTAKYILMSLNHGIKLVLLCLMCSRPALVLGQTDSIPNPVHTSQSPTIDEIYHQVLELLNAGKARKRAYQMAHQALELANSRSANQLDKWKARFIYEYASQEFQDEHARPYKSLRQLITEVNTAAPGNKALRRNIYHSLTSSCLLLNKLDSAVFYAQAADQIGSELFGEVSCERVMDYFLLSYGLIESAQDEQALIVAKKALNIAETHCSNQSEAYIDAHRLMGYYYIKSNYKASRAIPYYQRALRTSMKIKDADRAFKSLYFICRTALLSNDTKLLNEHIHFFDSIQLISDHITAVKSNLARLDIEFTMARQNQNLSLAILKKHKFKELLLAELPERETAIFESYYSIVDMSIKANRKNDVLRYLSQLDEYTKEYELNQDQLLSYYQIKSDGGILVGRWNDALTAAQEGIKCLIPQDNNIVERLPALKEVSDLFFYRLYLINCAKYYDNQYHQRGELSDLIKRQKSLSQVVSCAIRMIERDDERMSKQSTGDIARDFEHLISVDMKLFELTDSDRYLEEAFQLTDVASNLTFFRGANQRRAMTRTHQADSLIELKKMLTQELITLQLNHVEKSSLSHFIKEKKELDLSIKISQIHLYFEEHEPLYMSNIRAINSVPIDSFQNKVLDSTTAFVQYFYFNQLYAYLVLKDQVIAIGLPIREDFLTDIANYRDCISSPNSPIDSFALYSRRLGSVLLDSILIHLPQRINKLIIVPYGALMNISFEGLLHKTPLNLNFEALPYLIKKYAVSYAFSMTSKYRGITKQNKSNARSFLGVCPLYKDNPLKDEEIGERSRNDLFHLQGAENEVLALGRLIKNKRLLVGEDATKENVIAQLSNHSIWHFAMHALVDEDNPMLSSLYLANQGKENSKVLTAAEIYNMDLETDMVVLSACNTGLGKYDYIQGGMSLARAFAYAGARSTILSSWPAPDQATSEFFPVFYRHLIDGQSKAIALQNTKVEWLAQSKSRQFHHPYYWSTFTLWGNSEPLNYLTSRTGFPWNIVVGLAMCLILGWFVFARSK